MSPTATMSSATVPAIGAASDSSIFIDSRTTIASPASTASPTRARRAAPGRASARAARRRARVRGVLGRAPRPPCHVQPSCANQPSPRPSTDEPKGAVPLRLVQHDVERWRRRRPRAPVGRRARAAEPPAVAARRTGRRRARPRPHQRRQRPRRDLGVGDRRRDAAQPLDQARCRARPRARRRARAACAGSRRWCRPRGSRCWRQRAIEPGQRRARGRRRARSPWRSSSRSRCRRRCRSRSRRRRARRAGSCAGHERARRRAGS